MKPLHSAASKSDHYSLMHKYILQILIVLSEQLLNEQQHTTISFSNSFSNDDPRRLLLIIEELKTYNQNHLNAIKFSLLRHH